jgi:hypothetical protein
MESVMTIATIAGNKFEVPEAVLAKFTVGYTLATEGEASTMRQVLVENLRNNFANKVKKELNGSDTLSDEAAQRLQAEFNEYANSYSFGVRAVGTGSGRITDPLEREMLKLAKDDIAKAFYAKHKERLKGEQLTEAATKLLEARHDDYAKRAKRILTERERAGLETLEAVGL